MLPLTVPEVRRLLIALIWPTAPPSRVLAWSRWRRRHQARARRATTNDANSKCDRVLVSA